MRSLWVGLVLCLACSHDPLSDPEHIAGWANAASALGVFTHGYQPLALADGEEQLADSSCPSLQDDGTTLVITGQGCVDSQGQRWLGSARVVRSGEDRDLRFESYGKGPSDGPIARTTGSFLVTHQGGQRYAFEVELRQEGGVDTEIQYQGTVEGGYEGPTLWNGSGSVYRDSLVIHSGRVEARTEDQLRDNDICPGQGVSGRTLLRSPNHEVIIEYDGAQDCDEDSGARWSRDGEDRGVLPGVTCSSGGSSSWVLALLICFYFSILRRRKN